MLVCLCVLPWTLTMLSWPHPLLSSSLCVTWPLSLRLPPGPPVPARPPAGLPSPSFTAAAAEGCTSGGGSGDRGRKRRLSSLFKSKDVRTTASFGLNFVPSSSRDISRLLKFYFRRASSHSCLFLSLEYPGLKVVTRESQGQLYSLHLQPKCKMY